MSPVIVPTNGTFTLAGISHAALPPAGIPLWSSCIKEYTVNGVLLINEDGGVVLCSKVS